MLKAQFEYFKNLDGLRFLCFLAVFTVHSLHTDDPQIKSNFLFKTIVDGLLANGDLGVNFFFVLSGFLITFLLILEKQDSGKINIINFWIKRVIRIWPLYFICVFFGFVIFPFIKGYFGQSQEDSAELKYYLLFLGNFDIIKNGWPNATELGILWSISIEEQFYLVWPILLSVFPIKKYWIIFLGIILMSITFRCFNFDPLVYRYHTFSCISDMAVGGLGAWIIHVARVREYIVKLSKLNIALIYIAFGIAFIFKVQLFEKYYFTSIFERLIISVLIVLIILEQNYSLNSFYKMGNFKLLSKLGLTTFGNYMLHIICLLIVFETAIFFKLSSNIYTTVIILPICGLVLTLIVGKLSFIIIEKPFLNLRRFLK